MRAFFGCLGHLALVLTLAQCGGGSATGEGPKGADGHDSSDSSPHSGKREREREANEEEESNASAASPEKSQAATCDDGTCSKCGSGICLAGWYCDEKASGGGACSWLSECAEKPSCGCVTRVLGASCKCREEDGGLKVACD